MSGKTEVNRGLLLLAMLKEIPPTSDIFAGIYGTHSLATTALSTQNVSKPAGPAVTASQGVFLVGKNNNDDRLSICLTSLSKLKIIFM